MATTPTPSGGSSAADKALNALGGTGSQPYGPFAAADDTPQVYMGKRSSSTVEPRGAGGGSRPIVTKKVGESDDIVDQDKALGQFYKWVGTPDYSKWGQHLVDVGLIDPEDQNDYATLSSYWEKAVAESASAYKAGRKIDPWEMAKFMGSAGTGRSKGFTGTKTSVQHQVNLTDPESAKALVNDVLSRQLGRAARPEEISAFTAVLNNAERSNPATATTTTTYADGDATESSSVSEGGLDSAGKQQILNGQAMKKPEYGAYQSASTYFNALQQALGATVAT